jgi:hypothetical protein
MKRAAILALAVAVIAGFVIWWFSPTQVVKRRTMGLLDTVSMEAGSGRVTRQMGNYSVNRYLSQRVELDIPSVPEANGSFDRATLETGFSSLANLARQTSFQMSELRSIDVEGDLARVSLMVDALVEMPSYRPVDGLYLVNFQWRREEDGWRLVSASWVEQR